jgi:hypothetical protein
MIRPDEEPAVWVFSGIVDGKRMVNSVAYVLVGDTVLARRRMISTTPSVLRNYSLVRSGHLPLRRCARKQESRVGDHWPACG